MDKNSIIKVTWEEYFELLTKLINKILSSDYNPNQIICISRGGLIPGDIISRTLRLPLAILSVSSYNFSSELSTELQGEIMLSRDLTTAMPLRSKILLVDDLTDSGTTLERSIEWLTCYYKPFIREIRTAVIWHKETSNFQPDFYAKLINFNKENKCPWILQPQEALANKISKR